MAELNKICRACLNTIEYPKYVFFDNVSPDVFLFCTSIEIVQHEELPKVICDSCYDLLLKLSEFKKTCLQSHKTLLNYSVKSEKLEIFTEALLPPNVCKINNVWSFEKTQSLFSNDGNDIDNIVKKEEFEDHNGIDLDSSAVEEFHLPKRKYKVCKRSKENPAKKKYTCELCNKNFLHLDRFKLHNLRHQKKKSLECTPCNKIFRTLSGLRRHRASWHASVKLSTVKCHTCGKVTGNRETLKDHMKLHQERRQYICNVCGKGYSTTCNLKDHLETHQENRERQYTCEHCGKKFFTKKILVSHVTSCHTGRRVNNKKKERQKRYREQNREKLKQREAERRKRIQHSQSISGPSTSSNANVLEVNSEEKSIAGPSNSSNINILEVNNEKIITALQKKRECQRRYRERNREKLKQREAERRRRMQNAELSTSPNIEFTKIIIQPIITRDEISTDSQSVSQEMQNVVVEVSQQRKEINQA